MRLVLIVDVRFSVTRLSSANRGSSPNGRAEKDRKDEVDCKTGTPYIIQSKVNKCRYPNRSMESFLRSLSETALFP